MSEVLNSPMFLAIVFPALTVMGTLPLLRWAVGGEKADVFASFSLGLACLIALVCAYGRPGEPFQFGMAAMIYGIGAASLLALFYSAYIGNQSLRLGLMGGTILLWVWIILGMPMNVERLFEASLAGTVLLVMSFLIAFRHRFELMSKGDRASPFISSLIVALFLFLFANLVENAEAAKLFSMGLVVVCVCSLMWLWPRFQLSFHENALLPISLSIAALAWDMWLHEQIFLPVLACLMLVFFSCSATEKVLQKSPPWMLKIRFVLLGLAGLLPAGLSLVFFDVFRNL